MSLLLTSLFILSVLNNVSSNLYLPTFKGYEEAGNITFKDECLVCDASKI